MARMPTRTRSSTPNAIHSRWKQLFLRVFIGIVLLHYISLILIVNWHLKDPGHDLVLAASELLLDNIPPAVVGNRYGYDTVGEVSEKKKESSDTMIEPRILWAIESRNTREEGERRQLLRETYLSYVDPASAFPTNGKNTAKGPPMFCSLLDVESGRVNQTYVEETCHFFYIFVIPSSTPSNQVQVEILQQQGNANGNDELSFDTILFHGTLKDWLLYTQQVSTKYSFNVMGWIQADVHVTPLEMTDFLSPRINDVDEQPFIVETPKTNVGAKCHGCLWDQENALRTGSYWMAQLSTIDMILHDDNDMAKKRDKEGYQGCFHNHRDDGLEFRYGFQECVDAYNSRLAVAMVGDEATKTRIGDDASGSTGTTATTATQRRKIIQRHVVGHQYKQTNMEYYRREYANHKNHLNAFQEFDKAHGGIQYISGKFSNNDKHYFTDEVSDMKSVLYMWGWHPNQVYVYDSIFPDFILQDYRWEEHLDFLHNPSVPSTGGGWWFWKAPLLEYHFFTQPSILSSASSSPSSTSLKKHDVMEYGDYIVYVDVDMTNHFGWLLDLLQAMDRRDANLALYLQPFKEVQWTKRDLYQLLCESTMTYTFNSGGNTGAASDDLQKQQQQQQQQQQQPPRPRRNMETDTSTQYAGGFIVLKRTEDTAALVRDYVQLVSNYHWISDDPSVINNLSFFQEHRRDQSILSLLIKCKYQERKMEEFKHRAIDDLGWFHVYTFQIKKQEI